MYKIGYYHFDDQTLNKRVVITKSGGVSDSLFDSSQRSLDDNKTAKQLVNSD